LAVQAPCDLGHEVFRKPQLVEGLMEGLGGVLRLTALTFQALLVLPTFFHQRCALYIRSNGCANSHTVFCTLHRRREGGP
jgi:hypothetical protein